ERGLHDLLLAHVMRKALGVAGFDQFARLDTLDGCGAALGLLRLAEGCIGLTHAHHGTTRSASARYETAASRRPARRSYRRPACRSASTSPPAPNPAPAT